MKGKQDRRDLADAMARKVVAQRDSAARENADRVKRPGRARALRPPVRPITARGKTLD